MISVRLVVKPICISKRIICLSKYSFAIHFLLRTCYIVEERNLVFYVGYNFLVTSICTFTYVTILDTYLATIKVVRIIWVRDWNCMICMLAIWTLGTNHKYRRIEVQSHESTSESLYRVTRTSICFRKLPSRSRLGLADPEVFFLFFFPYLTIKGWFLFLDMYERVVYMIGLIEKFKEIWWKHFKTPSQNPITISWYDIRDQFSHT